MRGNAVPAQPAGLAETAGEATTTTTGRAAGWPAVSGIALLTLLAAASAAASASEEQLRASWVGRWVVLRTAALSNCDERYTDNRMRGPRPSSSGIHRFDTGEIGRVDNLHLQRARIDLLISLVEPLRVELRDGPFQLYEQLACRVELEVPAPREAVRRSATPRLEAVIEAVLERHDGRQSATASPLWNRRIVEPLPDDHEERLAAYRAWKEEQLQRALRGRLAEALDRVADLAARAERSVPYARGLVEGARLREDLYTTDCLELPTRRHHPERRKPPEELEGRQAEDWRDGFEDGQRLRFEVALARRIESCLP